MISNIFTTYLTVGIEHITDFHGYDHMLFIAALMAPFKARDIKKILWLITAFTIGHSLTLALSSYHIIPANANLIEFLIAATIFITAIGNFISDKISISSSKLNYGFGLFFGLIHGLGFSSYFQALLGRNHSILLPLFSFNVGVEIGQIIFVLLLLIIQFLLLSPLKISFKWWKYTISAIAAIVSVIMMIQKI